MEPVNIKEKFRSFKTHWEPKIVGDLNGQEVKLVKFQGEFLWHKHDRQDELFLVVEGSFQMQFREKSVWLKEGEFIIIPKGIEHCPKADEEVKVLLFEPAGTLNTGNVKNSKSVVSPEKI